jgi:hypothetical protein
MRAGSAMPRPQQPKEKIVMHNLTFATLSLLLLSGCATQHYVWNKPGISQAEFAQDKYTCVKEARSPSSSAYLSGGYYIGNAYVPASGGASSGEIVNGAFFKPCMEAKGYNLTTAQPTAAVQEVKTKLQAIASQLRACVTTIRTKPQYAVLASHFSDVTSGAFSISQLTDKSLATSAEAQAMAAYSDEANSSCSDQFRASAKAVVPALGPIFERSKAAADSKTILLVDRKITWGEYAQDVKQVREETASQVSQIHS